MPASCPAPEASSTTGSPRDSTAARSAARTAALIATGSVRPASSRPTAAIRRLSRSASGARTSSENVTLLGITLMPPGSTCELPDRRDRVLDRACGVANPQDLLRCGNERVLTIGHRRRAGVAGATFDRPDAALVADDARDDAERRTGLRQPGPLLVVKLDVRARESPGRDTARGCRRSRAPRRGTRRPRVCAAAVPAARLPRARRGRRAGRRSGRPAVPSRGASRSRPPAVPAPRRSAARSGCRSRPR